MAKVSDKMAKSFETEDASGVLSWLLAEEDELDRRALWRLGSWAVASAGAVIVAVLANQSSMGMRRDLVASSDLARQSQLIEQVARESQSEARRLASAVETLNGDRDRLYSRIAVLEHGLDSVTGATSRQNSAATSPQAGTPASSASQALISQASPSQGPPSQGPPAQAFSKEASSAQTSTTAASTGQASASPPTAASPASPAIPSAAATAVASSTEAPASAQKPLSSPAMPPVAGSAPAGAEKPPIVASGPDPRATPTSSAAPSASVAAVMPAASSLVSKSVLAPPDPAAPKMVEPAPPKVITAAPLPDVVASSSPSEDVKEQEAAATAPALAVQRTEFGVDVGGANSIAGLRAVWRGLLKWRSNGPLTAVRPIIVIKENQNGLGMQLRLVAGPISDAAAAAKICATMIANDRPCTTAVFEGQRLVMNPDEAVPAPGAEAKPGSEAKQPALRRYSAKRANPKDDTAPKTDPSNVSSIFGHTNR
jgi:hypothetical protein